MSGHAMWDVEELQSHAESVGTIARNVSGAAKVGQPMSGGAYGIIGQLFAGQVIATDSSVSASVGKLAQDVRDHQTSLQASMRAYQEVEREHSQAFQKMNQDGMRPPRVNGGQTAGQSASGGASKGAGAGSGAGGGSAGPPSGEEEKDGEGSSDTATPTLAGAGQQDGKGTRAELDEMGSRLDTLDGRLDELEAEQDKLDEEHRRLERELGRDDLAPGEREKLERQLEGVEREQEKLQRQHDELAGEYDTLQGEYDRLDEKLDEQDQTQPDGSASPSEEPTVDEPAGGLDRRPLSLIGQALLGTREDTT